MKYSRFLLLLPIFALLAVLFDHFPGVAPPLLAQEGLRASLNRSGLSAVRVVESSNGVWILTGEVLTPDERNLAEDIVRSEAPDNQPVYDEVSVLLPDIRITGDHEGN